ncbi:MAG: hypothetical protein H7308_09080 [Chthonomonadaceae bacterium]|nr:hypothetical protein [Chthonomonadaceae bacterium]
MDLPRLFQSHENENQNEEFQNEKSLFAGVMNGFQGVTVSASADKLAL